jgi:hypothetical protein|tara:strand:- start:1173 stop:1766 length:594 start_codon:yes stop_codon:yes gene_type:complete
MPFFSDTGPGGFQPKRAFRFLVTFSELSDLTFMVKNAKKPSYQLASTAHQVLNHQFNFPGIVKWDPISVTFIDAVDPNVGSKFYSALVNSGYIAPTTESALVTGVTKVGTTSTLGEVRIKQLDGGGLILPAGSDPGEVIGAVDSTNILEEWTLKNAFVNQVQFGETLGYDSEDLVTVTVSLTYDYATYNSNVKAYAG